jgi:hypothetical protein
MTNAEKLEYLRSAMLEAYGALHFNADGVPRVDDAAMYLRVALDEVFPPPHGMEGE